MKYYLKEDVINSKTRVPYGVKGEVVTTISLHDKCHIVQGEKERFGVNESLLSEEFISKNTLDNGTESKKKVQKKNRNK
jgi:hypothetical protein